MELMKSRCLSIKVTFLILTLTTFYSCSGSRQGERTLECLLSSIEYEKDDVYIEVGQHNGWSDTTALIIITYHEKSMNLPNSIDLKGRYNGQDVYFYQTNIDPKDTKQYNQIPNGIIWKNNLHKTKDLENKFHPPYDPVFVQVEYNTKRGCVNGRGHMVDGFESKCNSCPN